MKCLTRATRRCQPKLSFLFLSRTLLLDTRVSCSGAQLVHVSVHCVRKRETTDHDGLGSPAAHYNFIYSTELNSRRSCSWPLRLDCPQNCRTILESFLPDTAAIFPNHSIAWSGNRHSLHSVSSR